MDLNTALTIIDRAYERSRTQAGADEETIAALRFLTAHVERDTLIWFWESLNTEHPIGRTQNVNASRNRIRFLLGREGR